MQYTQARLPVRHIKPNNGTEQYHKYVKHAYMTMKNTLASLSMLASRNMSFECMHKTGLWSVT